MIIRKYCPPASDHNMQITVGCVSRDGAKRAEMADTLTGKPYRPGHRRAVTLARIRFQTQNYGRTAQQTDKFHTLIGDARKVDMTPTSAQPAIKILLRNC